MLSPSSSTRTRVSTMHWRSCWRASPAESRSWGSPVAGNTGLHHTAPNAGQTRRSGRPERSDGVRRRRAPMATRHRAGHGSVPRLQRPGRLPTAALHTDRLEAAIPLLVRLVEEQRPAGHHRGHRAPDQHRRLHQRAARHRPEGRADRHHGRRHPGCARQRHAHRTSSASTTTPAPRRRVFDFGVPITVIGLNVSHRAILFGSAHLAGLYVSGGPIAAMVKGILGHYGEHAYSAAAWMAAYRPARRLRRRGSVPARHRHRPARLLCRRRERRPAHVRDDGRRLPEPRRTQNPTAMSRWTSTRTASSTY